jgi:HPt (histidine-containing phosphotransfer) domain-containing protein
MRIGPYTGLVSDSFSFEDFLAQQRAEYRASLPGRLQQLEAAWAAGAWRDLERCAHGLAGSAATFGLPALGDAARELEEAVERAQPQPDAAAREALARQVEALADLLRSTT